MSGLSLADLFDLEVRTLDEKAENEELRRSRYRNLGRRILDDGIPPSDNGALLKALLRLDPKTPTPGARFEAAVGWFHTLLAAAGLVCGAVLSVGLLHYGGPHPVNVLNVLAVMVGVQILLLLLLLAALIPRNRARAAGPVQGLLRLGLRKLVVRVLPDAGPERLSHLEDRLDAHQGLLRWLILRSAQVFGVSFNVAALAGCLYRIVFSDVAFGWSTTLRFDATGFRGIAEALSAPWAWAFPQGVPTQTLVEMTQYSHLEGKYLLRAAAGRSADPSLVGGWWPFVLLSIATYGFLPRLIVLLVSALRVRGILRKTPSRNDEFRRIADWMRLPLVTTQAEGSASAPPAPAAGRDAQDPPLPPPGASCDLLLDGSSGLGRDVLERIVRERFGWTVASVLAPKDLGQARGPAEAPLVLVLSAWEEPTKGNQRQFHGLPKDRLIVVGLLNPSGGDDPRLERIRERWKRHLHGALRDHRLRVEPLGARP